MNAQVNKASPKVTTTEGVLEGLWMQSPGRKDIAAFLGVPFAKPPVGNLRWRAPEPPAAWRGIRQSKSFGPACSQVINGEDSFGGTIARAFGVEPPKPMPLDYSEDCLYLNVFTESADPGSKRPVMVWIHGGAFMFGTSANYDPQHIVRKGIVVVTINYRLGVLGFLAHPELTAESPYGASGNYGMLDQIEALRWVKRNIAAFGGDPNNVTIFGESAGGQSVAMLMVSPPAAGLFHRAISESGVGLHVHTFLKKPGFVPHSAEERGVAFARAVGTVDLAGLRAIPASKLVAAAAVFAGVTGPIIDGYAFAEHPVRSFDLGHTHKVPFMLGSNSDEGTALYWGTPMVEIPPGVDTIEKYKTAIRRVFDQKADRVLEVYPAATNEEMLSSSKSLFGDSLFGAQAHYVAKQMARAGQSPYLYFFSRKPAGKAGEILGAYHASEISYVFGVSVLGLMTAEDLKMSEIMMDYWVQFARTGDPNIPGKPQWTPFNAVRGRYMQFDRTAAMAEVARLEKYNLLEGFYENCVKG